LLNNLYNNQDSTYGDGYRMMKKKLINKGWQNIINDFKSRKKY